MSSARGERRWPRRLPRRRLRMRLAAGALLLSAAALAVAGLAPPARSPTLVADASPAAIARRMLSPLVHRALADATTPGRAALQAVPQAEPTRHEIRIPRTVGERPLGLLVFVPPTDRFRIPPAWHGPLDEAGLVLVVAHDSGNAQDVLARRVPLALQGVAVAAREHRIDPSRIYVAGFSGGSRVAQMLAVGYPDVFRGALLMAGSDPLGSHRLSVPPAELMSLVQVRSRIVLATGRGDSLALERDRQAAASFRRRCVDGLLVDHASRRGHSLPAAAEFRRGLELLQRPVDAENAGGCRARLEVHIRDRLARIAADAERGRLDDAGAALRAVDIDYGGLAAPATLALAARLDALAAAAAAGDG